MNWADVAVLGLIGVSGGIAGSAIYDLLVGQKVRVLRPLRMLAERATRGRKRAAARDYMDDRRPARGLRLRWSPHEVSRVAAQECIAYERKVLGLTSGEPLEAWEVAALIRILVRDRRVYALHAAPALAHLSHHAATMAGASDEDIRR